RLCAAIAAKMAAFPAAFSSNVAPQHGMKNSPVFSKPSSHFLHVINIRLTAPLLGNLFQFWVRRLEFIQCPRSNGRVSCPGLQTAQPCDTRSIPQLLVTGRLSATRLDSRNPACMHFKFGSFSEDLGDFANPQLLPGQKRDAGSQKLGNRVEMNFLDAIALFGFVIG